MLREGGGPSIQQEGCGSVFQAMGMDEEDRESIVESIVRFLEKASAAEANMMQMESRMSQMEQALPPQAAYFTSQQLYAPPQIDAVPQQGTYMQQAP